MKLFIKYMVSIRCKMVVQSELEKLGLHPIKITLGEAEIADSITEEQRSQIAEALRKVELELINDRKSILIEKIKNEVIELVHYSEELPKTNLSVYLSKRLNYDYTYLANLFSEVQGTSIKHFMVVHKIEKVKELLVYDELSLTEIAYKLDYSSVAHLSNQFKKITGLPPSHFKSLQKKRQDLA